MKKQMKPQITQITQIFLVFFVYLVDKKIRQGTSVG
jgi:hypothetical protein